MVMMSAKAPDDETPDPEIPDPRDHYTEALHLVDHVHRRDGWDADYLAIAQVHAMLAVADAVHALKPTPTVIDINPSFGVGES